jgi:amino acid transporter
MKQASLEIAPFILFIFLVNLIIGTGVFLNATRLFDLLGKYSFMAYVMTGILVFPILLVTYNLSRRHQGKNMVEIFHFYFGCESNFFVSLYSIAKLATAGVAIVFSANILHVFFDSFGCFIYTEMFFIFILGICFFLSYFDYSISPYVQFLIIFFKMIPIVLTIGLLFYFLIKKFFFANNFLFVSSSDLFFSFDTFSSLCEGIAMTIFSFAGFEALFSMGHYRLRSKNGLNFSVLLVFGFLVAWILYVLYQFGMGYLVSNSSSVGVFGFLRNCFKDNEGFNYLLRFMNLCVFASSFGVAHGITYTASNNLSFSLKEFKFSKRSLQIFVFLLLFFYGVVFFNKIFLLQQLSSLGTILTYFIFVYCYSRENINFLAFLGFLSCIILLSMHLYTAIFYLGFFGYFLYFFFAFILFFLFKKDRYCLFGD